MGKHFDVVIVGGTPGGIMAAIAAAREGRRVALLERSAHIGGLCANGLGATDIGTRGATGGLFLAYVNRVQAHYVEAYGAESEQVRACSGGYRFEPHVAAQVFDAMLAEQGDRITVRTLRQFDAEPDNVTLDGRRLSRIRITNRETGEVESYDAHVFIDATYEGDLAAAAGTPYRLGREDVREFDEPMAGRLYKSWGGDVGQGSDGRGDNAIQSYNYRLCLTNDPDNRVPIPKPESYDRADYASLVHDIVHEHVPGAHSGEKEWDNIGRITNIVMMPNDKTDANNQHLAFLSTDLPEENWPWPTASWDWRDNFAKRQRDYTLGLFWFVQHDPALPEDYRQRCLAWGLAADEYVDNDHFPRQVYVREGRRILGEHLFSAHDAQPVVEGGRPPVYSNSITASHYSLDSHAVRKREPGRVHLDGFFSYPSKPYTVPYGVIVPQEVDGLLIPVPASATHIGFSTLRMEPCWMALGEAAGVAASLAIEMDQEPRRLPAAAIQHRLLDHGAVLLYFEDVGPDHPGFAALQFLALRGYLPASEWRAGLDEPISDELAAWWRQWSGISEAEMPEAASTRGEMLEAIYQAVRSRAANEQARLQGPFHWGTHA